MIQITHFWKKRMTKMNTNMKVILGCTVALVVFLSFAMYFMWIHLEELSASPLVYGAKKVAEGNGAEDVRCSCQLIGSAKLPFHFNTTNIWSDQSIYEVNLSLQRYK